jgi:general secretion pathway protein D
MIKAKVWLSVALVMALSLENVAQEQRISMDFQGVDFPVFLQWFASLTKKKIIYSEVKQSLVQKKVYLIAPEPVPIVAIEKICMSLLESNGFTLVKTGQGASEVYKLVETSQAVSKPIAIYSMEELSSLESGDYYISQLILIKYLKVEQVTVSLRQAKLLDPQAGNIVEIKGVNALIISDFLPNIKRVVKIIEMLDQPATKLEVVFITLKHAKAEEVSQKIGQVYQNRAREISESYGLSGMPTIVADTRTNSLILRATPEEIKEIKELIAHLDQEIKESEVVAKIYHLKHVTPDKILPTIKEFITTQIFQEKSVTQSQTPLGNPQISVIPNEHTKTLLITAPAHAHKLIEEVIKELDVRRPQVLLEAVICEFTPSDVLNLGLELMNLDNMTEDKGTFGHGITSFGLSSIVDQAGNPVSPQKPSTPTGRTLSPGSGLVSFITKDKATNIPLLIRTLQSVTYTDVISVPRILTDDGERAEIRVEQEEPVTSINALNTSTTTTSFKEFVPAGTVLIIKPHIIHNNWLKLEIEQNIEAFVGTSPTAGVPPAKSSRSIKTVVSVPNGHIVILGGLCGRREVETIDKIPILGDIPLLGLLFSSRSRSVTKTNLYIFIQPKILYQPEFQDLKTVSQEALEKVKQLQGNSLKEQQIQFPNNIDFWNDPKIEEALENLKNNKGLEVNESLRPIKEQNK